MDAKLASGMIGIIFLVLCIGFVSFMQPAPRQASAQPFLAPTQTASAEAIYLNDKGQIAVSRE